MFVKISDSNFFNVTVKYVLNSVFLKVNRSQLPNILVQVCEFLPMLLHREYIPSFLNFDYRYV